MFPTWSRPQVCVNRQDTAMRICARHETLASLPLEHGPCALPSAASHDWEGNCSCHCSTAHNIASRLLGGNTGFPYSPHAFAR